MSLYGISLYAGFQTPILHGLCSYGIATRHVLRQYCGDDVAMVKAIKARFSKPVLPGQTIQTDMWKEGDRVHFICKVCISVDVTMVDSFIYLRVAFFASEVHHISIDFMVASCTCTYMYLRVTIFACTNVSFFIFLWIGPKCKILCCCVYTSIRSSNFLYK